MHSNCSFRLTLLSFKLKEWNHLNNFTSIILVEKLTQP